MSRDINEIRLENLNSRKWTQEEIDIISKLYPTTDAKVIGTMIDRSKASVEQVAFKNNIRKIKQEYYWNVDSTAEHLKEFYRENKYAPTKEYYCGRKNIEDKPSIKDVERCYGGINNLNNALSLITKKEYEKSIEKEVRIEASKQHIINFFKENGRHIYPIEYDETKPQDAYSRRTLEKYLDMTLLDCSQVINDSKKLTWADRVIIEDIEKYVIEIAKDGNPSCKQVCEHFGCDIKVFFNIIKCSFNKFCENIGVTSHRADTTHKSKKQIDTLLQELYFKLNRTPTVQDIDMYCGVSFTTVMREYGSIEEACKANGIDYTPYNLGTGRVTKDNNGVLCRSTGEQIISNFLIDNNIIFEKEINYSELFECENKRWRCDWVIHFNNKKWIVEYFGMITKEYLLKTENKKASVLNSEYCNRFIPIYPNELSEKILKDKFNIFLC